MRTYGLEPKKIFDLQLFADGGEESSAPGAEAGLETNADESTENPTLDKSSERNEEENPPAPKYTDEDLDRILSKKFAAWQRKKDAEVDEAKKLASMSQEQRTAHELQQLKEELDGYKRANTLNEMGKAARGILSEKGISASDDLINLLISDDAETTKKAVDSFANLFQAAVEKAIKEKLRGEPPKAGKAKAGMTKEQIMAIKDPSARKKAIAENMDLFH